MPEAVTRQLKGIVFKHFMITWNTDLWNNISCSNCKENKDYVAAEARATFTAAQICGTLRKAEMRPAKPIMLATRKKTQLHDRRKQPTVSKMNRVGHRFSCLNNKSMMIINLWTCQTYLLSATLKLSRDLALGELVQTCFDGSIESFWASRIAKRVKRHAIRQFHFL